MADHLTEEEQIEALKTWWNDNWLSIVAPIVLVAFGYIGWNYWQTQTDMKAKEGSTAFEALLKTVEVAPGETLSAEKKAEAQVLAVALTDSHKGSLYADQSALILAKLAVEDGNLAKAAEHLNAVVTSGSNSAIQQLAKARLARVKIGLGEFDQALGLVASVSDEAFKSIFAELRGDALLGQGERLGAKTAYQEALDSLDLQDFRRRNIVELKLSGVNVVAHSTDGAQDQAEPSTDAATGGDDSDNAAASNGENS